MATLADYGIHAEQKDGCKLLVFKEALALGHKHYLPKSPCKNGHYAKRFVSNGGCSECLKISNREYYYKNIESQRERSKKYQKDDPVGHTRRSTAYFKKHHKEERFSAMMAHYRMARRTREKQAMPEWADEAELKGIYRMAARMTRDTGISHHVDHIVPLSNSVVCGLHLPCNLRIVTARENQRKSNKFTVGAS